MRLNDLDLNQLIILDALLKEKSVSKAAERVFLSQPALSSALKRLREFFHDPLLVAVGRKMVLTPLATELVKPVGDVLLQIKAIASNRPKFDPAVSNRTISLTASDYVLTVLIPEVLRRAKKEAPHLKVRLRPLGYKWKEELEEGEVDFTITADGDLLDDYPKEVLFRDKLCCVAWSKNRKVDSRISLQEFLQMGHVVVEFSAGRLPTMQEVFFKKSGLSRNIEVFVPDFNMMPHFIIGTDRIACFQTHLARFYAKHMPLKIIPMPIDIPWLVEILQYHRYQELNPACMWFRSLLKAAAKEMPIIA